MAMPKSMSRGLPSSPIITFSGFRSRWRTPMSCAAASPEQMPLAMASPRPRASVRSCSSMSFSVRPGRYSIETNSSESISTRS